MSWRRSNLVSFVGMDFLFQKNVMSREDCSIRSSTPWLLMSRFMSVLLGTEECEMMRGMRCSAMCLLPCAFAFSTHCGRDCPSNGEITQFHWHCLHDRASRLLLRKRQSLVVHLCASVSKYVLSNILLYECMCLRRIM